MSFCVSFSCNLSLFLYSSCFCSSFYPPLLAFQAIKDGEGAEAAKMCSLREEWRTRFKRLMSTEVDKGGEGGTQGETEKWSVPRRPSLHFSHIRPGDMASGELGATAGPEKLPAGAAAGKEKQQAAHRALSQHSQPAQQQQPQTASESSKLHRRLCGKDSCRHRHARRRPIAKETAQKTQDIPGDLCYDTWSHLEVSGHLRVALSKTVLSSALS